MARSIIGGRPDLPKTPLKKYRETILEQAVEQLNFVLAHRQVLGNDIKHVEANVLMLGKDTDKHPYVTLLRELLANQHESVGVITTLIDSIHRTNFSNKELDDILKAIKSVVDAISPMFRDYAVMKSSEFVNKYQQ